MNGRQVRPCTFEAPANHYQALAAAGAKCDCEALRPKRDR
jgi:hypothetical protein